MQQAKSSLPRISTPTWDSIQLPQTPARAKSNRFYPNYISPNIIRIPAFQSKTPRPLTSLVFQAKSLLQGLDLPSTGSNKTVLKRLLDKLNSRCTALLQSHASVLRMKPTKADLKGILSILGGHKTGDTKGTLMNRLCEQLTPIVSDLEDTERCSEVKSNRKAKVNRCG